MSNDSCISRCHCGLLNHPVWHTGLLSHPSKKNDPLQRQHESHWPCQRFCVGGMIAGGAGGGSRGSGLDIPLVNQEKRGAMFSEMFALTQTLLKYNPDGLNYFWKCLIVYFRGLYSNWKQICFPYVLTPEIDQIYFHAFHTCVGTPMTARLVPAHVQGTGSEGNDKKFFVQRLYLFSWASASLLRHTDKGQPARCYQRLPKCGRSSCESTARCHVLLRSQKIMKGFTAI